MNNMRIKFLLEAVDRITEPVRRLSSQFQQQMQRMQNSVHQVGSAFDRFGKSLSLKVSAPIGALGVMAVRQSASFEKMKASLETVTGSVEAADKAFKSMVSFAAKTPFQLEEIMQGFIKLKALGLDPSEEALYSYGNTASAMGKSLDQFIEAIADASTGEFERLKEFGIRASQQGDQVSFTFQGITTTVRKNATEIEQYLRSIGQNQFAGAMNRQMQTLNGSWSNLKDTISNSLSVFGDSIARSLELNKVAQSLSEKISSLAKAFQNLPQPVQKILAYFGLFLTLIGPLLMGFGQIAMGIGFLTTGLGVLAPVLIGAALGFKALGLAILTTPLGWIALGVAALVTGALLLIKHWDKVKSFFISMWAHIKETFKTNIDFIMDRLKPLLNAMSFGKSLGGLLSGGSNDIQRQQIDLARPQNSKLDAGGQLNIQIDSTGRPSVMHAAPNDSRMGMNVNTGILMGGF
jgi:hypothetical protein